jgi:hypothetical protein
MSVQVQTLALELPKYFRPRSYQKEFFRAMRAGCKRAIPLWHRRAGKDDTALNWTIESMVQRPGGYYYFFPTYRQGKRILWEGIQADGRPFLDHFPKELVLDRNETDMKIVMAVPGGGHSLFQILGADKVDNSSIGTNPVGCVFSEYSLQNPKAWDLVRPILAENEGWAVFPYTPRGKNWGHKLWQAAREDATWFTSMRTVDQTRRDGDLDRLTPRYMQAVVSQDAIEAERRSGMAEELIQQEFYCSFEGAIMGSYYGDAIERMVREGRIREVPWNREVEVDTAWDLGIGDDETVIGFFQTIPDVRSGRDDLHLVDVHAGRNQGFAEYWRFMRNERPYTYGLHYGPHDLKVHEWHGSTRLATAGSLGLHFQVVPKLGIADGINAVRRMLPYLWVDEKRCAKWIDMMRAYHREFDEERMTFRDKPEHDEASHWADMTRYRAVAYEVPTMGPGGRRPVLPDRADIDYSVFESNARQLAPWDRSRNAPDWSVFDR